MFPEALLPFHIHSQPALHPYWKRLCGKLSVLPDSAITTSWQRQHLSGAVSAAARPFLPASQWAGATGPAVQLFSQSWDPPTTRIQNLSLPLRHFGASLLFFLNK